MNWNKLTQVDQLEAAVKASEVKPVLLFKHSTRCSISATALNRLEREWQDADAEKIEPYYLDLIAYREISNVISEKFNVMHESPQVLVIKSGICSYHNSHLGISYDEIMTQV